MANLESIKSDANKNAKILCDYLRKLGLIGDSPADRIRDYRDEQEQVLYGALLAADDLARRIATL